MATPSCACTFVEDPPTAIMCNEHYALLEQELAKTPNVVDALFGLINRVAENHIVRGEN